MSHSTSIRSRLRSAGIAPRKSLGQNFLTDDDTARRIVRLAGIQPGEVVLEIGPGIGALTRHLAQAARHVIAIEIDRNLIPILQQELAGAANVTILQADALAVDFAALLSDAGVDASAPVRFVGNLPYYITSALIRRMLESSLDIRSIVLTVQLEVAERIVAQPGDMSLLSVSVQVYGKPEQLMRLSPSVFYPQPDVDSAVVRITPYHQCDHPDTLFELARAGFSQRRKQLRNTLSAGLQLPKTDADELLADAAIDAARRAETLSIPEWMHLTEVYVQRGYAAAKRSDSSASDSLNNSDVAAPTTANSTEL